MTTAQWRPSAAYDADQVATSQAQFVDATRHDAVRRALTCLVDTSDLWRREDRIAHATDLLAAAVEKQARIAGLGRDIRIGRGAA